MAQSITLLGANYTDVPGVELPKTGGGNAYFADVTDTTATASDVASGTYFYNAAGVRTAGTASGGGGGSEEKQVFFIDYDGTTLHSYTKTEWAGVSALPANPSHAGLTAQGWNWTKAQIDAQLTALPNGKVWVGQMYITTSGATEIDITITDASRLALYLNFSVNGSAVIDWGDNSPLETVTGTSLTNVYQTPHTYAALGNYTISISISSGSASLYYGSTRGLLTANTLNSAASAFQAYGSMITAVRLGAAIKVDQYAFNSLVNLESITFPSGISITGSYTFSHSVGVKALVIPGSITTLPTYFISYCHRLETVSLPPNLSSIPGNFAEYCYILASITLPTGISSIGASAFRNCSCLNDVYIPNTVTTLGGSAFQMCGSLEIINIPSSVTSAGNYCIANCYNLKEVTIGNATITLGTYFFQNCYSLKKITTPSGLTAAKSSMLNGCYALEAITLASGITSIDASAFYNCGLLKSLTLPNTVTSIGNAAFRACGSLQSVNIPSGVTAINDTTFNGCPLQSITIPNTVTTIGANAFSTCYMLSSVTIPTGVTSIGNSAFASCYGVKEYHFKPTTPPTLGTTVFSGIPDDTIFYVPTASLTNYQTASGWSTYASRMVGE